MRVILVLCMLLIVGGCTSIPHTPHPLADGYQFGDLTRSAKRRIHRLAMIEKKYCEPHLAGVRHIVVKQIQLVTPAYPSQGLCQYYIDSEHLTYLPMGLSLGALATGLLML